MKMGSSKSFCVRFVIAVLFFIFSACSFLWAEEAPIVDFNLNMPLGASQDLKILNAKEGVTYSFALTGGTGNAVSDNVDFNPWLTE